MSEEKKIITRKEAKSLGLKHYFTGRPCKRGHICGRFVTNTTCVECARIHQKQYASRNPEKIKARFSDWKDMNPLYFQEYNDSYQKEYYLENRSRKITYQKEYYNSNKETIREKSKEYYINNKHIYSASRSKRRARENAADGCHDAQDVIKIYEDQNGLCAEPTCRKDLSVGYHVDHIMPLSLGGSNWPENLQCLCPTCNLRKHAKHPIDWAQENGRLL